jgi:rhamnosyltransferase
MASICAQAYYDGFSALLFFDQDTVFANSTLDFVREFYLAKPYMAVTHTAVVFNAKRESDAGITDRLACHDVLLAISSGSLFYLENVRRIGWHNPTYFVDCVDYEFCLNSNTHRLLVAECSTTPGFDHETEQADHTSIVFGRRRRLRRYSWSRVSDTFVACTRLLGTSLRLRNRHFAFAISRYLAAYVWWQLVSRV